MSLLPWIGTQHFPWMAWKQIAKGKLCSLILGKTDFRQNEVHVHAWSVRKSQPPILAVSFRGPRISPAVFADLPSNSPNENFCCSTLWHGFIYNAWRIFCCFPSPFYFLFQFQDNCLCARIAAVLFLELALSYWLAKHWAFCRKLGLPDLLLFSLGWS